MTDAGAGVSGKNEREGEARDQWTPLGRAPQDHRREATGRYSLAGRGAPTASPARLRPTQAADEVIVGARYAAF